MDLRVQLVDLVLSRHGELDEQLLVVLADEDVGRRGLAVLIFYPVQGGSTELYSGN